MMAWFKMLFLLYKLAYLIKFGMLGFYYIMAGFWYPNVFSLFDICKNVGMAVQQIMIMFIWFYICKFGFLYFENGFEI